MKKISLYLAADTVVDHMAKFLAKVSNAAIECSVAPYNQIAQVLLGAPQASNLLLWTSPDIQLPSYDRLLSFEQVAIEDVIADVDRFASLLKSASSNYSSIFVAVWTPPPDKHGPLGLAMQPRTGASDVLMRANIHLSDAVREERNIHLVDMTRIQIRYHKSIYDPRLYMMGRIRFDPDFVRYASEQIGPIIMATVQASRKVIVCDLDNTLWGGILGDDGLDGIIIGGPGAVGEAHLALQRALKALKNRGILLAISSKNSAETAVMAINEHPAMVLREADFSAQRINWDDKAANIASILDELNLLPSSAVFIDDSPTERQRVREALPGILVPELPVDTASWADIVGSLGCWETLTLSVEDRTRADSYKTESERRKSRELHVNIDDWLRSLDLVVSVKGIKSEDLQRAVQLLNKTNQFNLSTRRMSETEFADWSCGANRRCYVCTVADRYGDYGLTAVATVAKEGKGWTFVDFVMSCRVMGKGVEEAIVAEIYSDLKDQGPLTMDCIPTPKNGPAQVFASRVAPNSTILKDIAVPSYITVERDFK